MPGRRRERGRFALPAFEAIGFTDLANDAVRVYRVAPATSHR